MTTNSIMRSIKSHEYIGACRYNGYINNSIRLILDCGHEQMRKASSGVPRTIVRCRACESIRNASEVREPPQYKYNRNPVNKPKLQARSLVRRAILDGRLIRQPCGNCGESRSHAHHHDYSKPLDVQWLCSPCHGLQHRLSHCIRGHEMTDKNTRISRTKGTRTCLTCARDKAKEHRKNYICKRERSRPCNTM
jgi:hypothetical protein